jgi:hypothetical protein
VLRLKRSTWILLTGLVAAGIVLAAGRANTWRLLHKEQALMASCKARQAAAVRSSRPPANEPPPDPMLSKLSDEDLILLQKIRAADAGSPYNRRKFAARFIYEIDL